MRASEEYVRGKIEEFNKLFFKGELPPIPIRLSNARRALGMFVYPVRYPAGKPRGVGECHLRISTRLDLPERDVEDTIIHEMIHYYIWYKGIKDSSAHGEAFRAIMQYINKIGNRHITIRHKGNSEEDATDKHYKSHYICVTHWADGGSGLTVCARTRIFEINRLFSNEKRVKSIDWYWSQDPWFNKFPNSLTAKAYKVDTAELAAHLKTATPCAITGTRFHPK